MTSQNLLTDPAMAGTWTLEPERSSVRFVSKTLWGLVPVNGRFTTVTGEARVTTDGQLSGRLVIRADSVRTGIGWRDRHLRAADFFDVGNHPDIVVDLTGTAGPSSSANHAVGHVTPIASAPCPGRCTY
jgi:polyisoprenoid-binding protein YceI